MTKQMGLRKLPTVSDILKYVQDVQKGTARRCHLVLDEVIGEFNEGY